MENVYFWGLGLLYELDRIDYDSIVSIINSRSARVASLLPAIIVTHPRNKPYHTRSTPRIILFPACISPFLFRRSGLNIHQTPPQTSIYPITKPTSCCREQPTRSVFPKKSYRNYSVRSGGHDQVFTWEGFVFGGVEGESLFSRARNFSLDGKLTFSLLTWWGLIAALVGLIMYGFCHRPGRVQVCC